MKRIKTFMDSSGKHRWQFWISSDIVGASTQGYADRGDRDDNLCEVMGGEISWVEHTDNVVLVRTGVSDEGDLEVETIPITREEDADD